MKEAKILVEYVRRPEYGPVTKNIMEKVMSILPKDDDTTKEVDKIFRSTINNLKVGVMIAGLGPDNKVLVGYSQWNRYADDYYDKDEMMSVAIERMIVLAEKEEVKPGFTPKVPYAIAERLPAFLERCRKYFKDAQMPKWTEKW
jgi:hypothetical protein